MIANGRRRRRTARASYAAFWAALAVAILSLAVESAAAAPPLWRVESGKRIIYLFGTIELIQAGADWNSPELTAALQDSQMLLMENDPRQKEQKYESYLYTHSTDAMLSDILEPLDFVKLTFIAEELGYRMSRLNRTRPWFARELIRSAAIEKTGLTWVMNPVPDGMGQVRLDRMPTDGFEIYIETIEGYAAMPRAAEVEILSRAIRDLPKAVEQHREYAAAWLGGDEISLEKNNLVERHLFGRTGWDVMVARRSENWARRLIAILKGEGEFDRVFVAVPSRHLYGEDGLKAKLMAEGFEVERVQ